MSEFNQCEHVYEEQIDEFIAALARESTKIMAATIVASELAVEDVDQQSETLYV